MQSVILVPERTMVSSPMTVVPSSITLGYSTESFPMVTPASIHVEAGSIIRHPGIEPAMTNLLPHDLFGFSQLAPRIDAKSFVRILEPNSRHTASLLDRHLHDVRQVKFSLAHCSD